MTIDFQFYLAKIYMQINSPHMNWSASGMYLFVK